MARYADMATKNNRRFIVDVDETLRIVLEQEDTDGDFQVTTIALLCQSMH